MMRRTVLHMPCHDSDDRLPMTPVLLPLQMQMSWLTLPTVFAMISCYDYYRLAWPSLFPTLVDCEQQKKCKELCKIDINVTSSIS